MIALRICDALCGLVPFVQFKKREKHSSIGVQMVPNRATHHIFGLMEGNYHYERVYIAQQKTRCRYLPSSWYQLQNVLRIDQYVFACNNGLFNFSQGFHNARFWWKRLTIEHHWRVTLGSIAKNSVSKVPFYQRSVSCTGTGNQI